MGLEMRMAYDNRISKTDSDDIFRAFEYERIAEQFEQVLETIHTKSPPKSPPKES